MKSSDFSSYDLTLSAEADLKDIARKTQKRWGKKQTAIYAEKLEACFQKIADDKITPRTFSIRFPQANVFRCEHHFVFFIKSNDKKPVIIAVLYEHMDMLSRLGSRIQG